MRKFITTLLIIAPMLSACGGDGGGGGASSGAKASPDLSLVPGTTTTTTMPSTTTTVPAVTTTTTTLPPAPYAFGGGQGTLAQPYILQSSTDIQHIQDFPAAYFWLNNSIDMSGVAFLPISSFSGQLAGNNYVIDHLTMSGSGVIAMFQNMSGVITNLVLNNVSSISSNYAAALAGDLTGQISHCQISGSVTSLFGGNGFNTGTGNSIYVIKSGAGSVATTTQNVLFNTNHVTASF